MALNILQVLATSLHINPDQRFSCASCARCCRRLEIIVTPAEVESLRRRQAGQWFREAPDAPEGTGADPFTPIEGGHGYQLIRKRDDGACGFLSPTNRCRLHEELGAAGKPFACRAFPYSFHPAPGAVIVATSFTCPTVVANEGDRIGSGPTLQALSSLRQEWFAGHEPQARPRQLVDGRPMTPASVAVLRDGLLAILDRADGSTRDLRQNVRRMALIFDDLTRARVIRLADADFAEYVKLTVPFAAASAKPVPARAPTRLGRLLQRGFLFTVVSARERIEQRQLSRIALRCRTMQLLAHVHGLAPRVGRVNMAALKRGRVDINAPDIQPIAHRYLRATLEGMGASERHVLDAFAIAVSYLNAACALAVMNGGTFGEALMEAVDLSHADERGLLGRMLGQFTGGTEALYILGHAEPSAK
jgi:Fe-S-cluster containining protein